MTKLSQQTKDKIAKRAIEAAFQQRKDALAEQSHLLGMECYHSLYSPELLASVAALPDGWTRSCSCLRFNVGGWDASLTVKERVRTPHANDCSRLGDISGELAERAQAFLQDEKQCREDRWKAEAEMDGFLSSFNSFKQLREHWPEGEAFYGDLDVGRSTSGVPAVRVAQINKMLGIKEAA